MSVLKKPEVTAKYSKHYLAAHADFGDLDLDPNESLQAMIMRHNPRKLRPVMVFVLVTSVTGSIQIFDTVAVTTRGGPVNVTRVFQFYIYQKAFGEGQFGYGSALSVILFLILGVLAALQLRLLRSGESDLA